MPPRWSYTFAPARAVDRDVAECCRPSDPRPHAPDWLAPPQSGHSPRTDSPRPCEQSAPQLSCRPAAGLGFAVPASHRTYGRRAFDTRPEWYPAGPHSPLRRVPGNRVTGAGAHTARRENIAKRRQSPEVGAVCLNWARTDLCGGREVTRVPTAIVPMRGRHVQESKRDFVKFPVSRENKQSRGPFALRRQPG